MSFQTISKPWGHYTDFIREDNVVVKELIVKPGMKLSLQSHDLREEHWICVSGKGFAILGNDKVSLFPGQRIHVPKKIIHRIVNDSDELLRITEVQLGFCDEKDIIRYEDDFGRNGANN